MSQRGLRTNDWFSQICAGIFFFCIGALFSSIFFSADVSALGSQTTEDWIGLLIFVLIPVIFMDLALYLVISGWKRRHDKVPFDPAVAADGGLTAEQQKTVQAVSSGISTFYTINTWITRTVFAAAAVFAVIVTAFWLLTSKISMNEILLLILGLTLVSYVVIIVFMALRKP